VPVGVRKSDGCCNLNADLTTASLLTQRRSAHYAQSPELGELSKLNLSSCRYGSAVLADVQRFVYLSCHPQLVQHDG
jgi:hypothetical protein